MRDRGVGERPRPPWLGGVLAGPAVDEVQLLRLRVERLQLVVGDRPRRRDATVVLHPLEVALSQAEHDRSVAPGVATDEVLLVRLGGIAVRVVPELGREVALVAENLPAGPVLRLAGQ